MYNPQYRISVRDIKCGELLERFRRVDKFLPLCSQCPNFGKMWSCPPFDSDFVAFEKKTATCKIFLADIDTSQFEFPQNFDAKNEMGKIVAAARKRFDAKMLDEESRAGKGSRAFFAGACSNCPLPQCPRQNKKPCPRPDFLRPSLESLGFDVAAIAEELFNSPLQWASNDMLQKNIRLIAACTIAES